MVIQTQVLQCLPGILHLDLSHHLLDLFPPTFATSPALLALLLAGALLSAEQTRYRSSFVLTMLPSPAFRSYVGIWLFSPLTSAFTPSLRKLEVWQPKIRTPKRRSSALCTEMTSA